LGEAVVRPCALSGPSPNEASDPSSLCNFNLAVFDALIQRNELRARQFARLYDRKEKQIAALNRRKDSVTRMLRLNRACSAVDMPLVKHCEECSHRCASNRSLQES
jgi:hypothetical protein